MGLKSQTYQPYLNEVSRSFAFCIEQLREPFREQVGLSYLLLRILDTIEDSKWESVSHQKQCFDEFILAVNQNLSLPKAWIMKFSGNTTEAERKLVKVVNHLISDLHNWGDEPRSQLIRTINEMKTGMEEFLLKGSGKIRISNLEGLNQYCYYVAGTVGELLYNLQLINIDNCYPDSITLKLSHLYGITLQRANVIRDEKGDYEKGNVFISDKKLLLDKFIADLDYAFLFCAQVPLSERSLRRFLFWSLFLAIGSVHKQIQSTDKDIPLNKLDRTETELILDEVSKNIFDPRMLRQTFDLRLKKLKSLSGEFTYFQADLR